MTQELTELSNNKEGHTKYIDEVNSIPIIQRQSKEDFPIVSHQKYLDTHMHGDNIEGRSWKVPSVEDIVEYLIEKRIVQAGYIYENPQSILFIQTELERREEFCDIVPFYFIHNPFNIDEEGFDKLYTKGLIGGIKIHPVVDQYALTYDNLKAVLRLSKKYGGLPILTHLDDRKESMYLTAPHHLDKLVEDMADRDLQTPLILGHTGAYANPRLVSYPERPNKQVESYWLKYTEDDNPPYSRIYLIKHALQLALEYPFVYIDSSTCLNKIKARIMAKAINNYPILATKVLMGTDFPVRSRSKELSDGTESFLVGATIEGQLRALWTQGLREENLVQIASNRIPS
jgi:hypothetical protein